MRSSIFQIWKISALKVYLKLNQKVVLITLSTHDKPSLNMQKKSGQIVLYLEIFNFKTFRSEILQIFELLIWEINDFINSFWNNLTFNKLKTSSWLPPAPSTSSTYNTGIYRRLQLSTEAEAFWSLAFSFWLWCKKISRRQKIPKQRLLLKIPYKYFSLLNSFLLWIVFMTVIQ